MAKVQLGKNLSNHDVSEIVAFPESLTGKLPNDFATAPVLPAAGYRAHGGPGRHRKLNARHRGSLS